VCRPSAIPSTHHPTSVWRGWYASHTPCPGTAIVLACADESNACPELRDQPFSEPWQLGHPQEQPSGRALVRVAREDGGERVEAAANRVWTQIREKPPRGMLVVAGQPGR
jgi:hypothetical protein